MEKPKTRPEDRVPVSQKLAIGVGAFANTTGTQQRLKIAFIRYSSG